MTRALKDEEDTRRNRAATWLTDAELDAFEAYCERIDRTKAWVMRKGIELMMKEGGKKK